MEKLLKPYDKEDMKMAMLKHEETFREQVYELHRLYRIQKILMKNIENSGSNGWKQERWNLNNHSGTHQKKQRKKLDLERPAEDYIAESDDDGMLEVADGCEIELTLGLTSHQPTRKKLEKPLTSDSGPSFSSSSTGSCSHIKKKTSSGSTHQSTHRRRGDPTAREWGLAQSEMKASLDVEEQLRPDRPKQHPWLFQVLSLNMT